MKRTPLTRKTRLRAKGRSRFPKRRNPEYVAWIRTLPCAIRDWTPTTLGARVVHLEGDAYRAIEAAHVKTRGAGGDDVGNVVPLCRWHHAEQHRIGIESFQAKYGVDLKAEAARLAAEWEGER